MSIYSDKQLESIWQNTLKQLKDSGSINADDYQAWYENATTLYDIDDELATIVVPYKLNKQIIMMNIKLIQTCLSEVINGPVSCQVLVNSEVSNAQPTKQTIERCNKVFVEDKILPQYTFDNFVVGKNNREAHVAALSVCLNPGTYNNPLFIFGNSGLGKTHLLNAIGNYVKEHSPEKKILYIYSEDFVTLLIESMKSKNVEEVKEMICDLDLLMIDDIQRLKQSTSQEIFFNLYNKLISNHKQIVITSDLHPTELKGIENRLISRFSSGLTVSVGTPEFETAKAILLKKLEGRNETIVVHDEVLDYLATRFASDVRKLEGSLNELFFKAILYNPDEIDFHFAMEVFKENPTIVSEESLSADRIKKAVCDYYGLTKSQIESKSRTKLIANARHIAVYLCRKHLQMPFVKIGFEFGNRDHSTIMSSYDKMRKLLKEKPDFQQALLQIETKLGIK